MIDCFEWDCIVLICHIICLNWHWNRGHFFLSTCLSDAASLVQALDKSSTGLSSTSLQIYATHGSEMSSSTLEFCNPLVTHDLTHYKIQNNRKQKTLETKQTHWPPDRMKNTVFKSFKCWHSTNQSVCDFESTFAGCRIHITGRCVLLGFALFLRSLVDCF